MSLMKVKTPLGWTVVGSPAQKGDPGPEGPQGATGADGEDGGYYAPAVDGDGNLTWTASKEGMPDIPGANIKGPAGESGSGSSYTLPVASASQLGGVKPVTATDEMTQDVGVTADGKLKAPAVAAPSDEQVKTAVSAYLDENPVTSGLGEWTLFGTVTTEELVQTISITGFNAKEVSALIQVANDDDSSTFKTYTAMVSGLKPDGDDGSRMVYSISMPSTTPPTALSDRTNSWFYSNGSFCINRYGNASNLGAAITADTPQDTYLLDTITSFSISHVMNAGRFAIGSTVTLYVR